MIAHRLATVATGLFISAVRLFACLKELTHVEF